MPKFSEVFSTTFKVVAALFLLSLIAGVIYFFMTHVSESSNARETLDDVHQAQAQRYAAAEAKHTSMPLSRWNKIVAAAIKQRCAFEGMYKDDVEKAFGKPTATQHNADLTETCPPGTGATLRRSRGKTYIDAFEQVEQNCCRGNNFVPPAQRHRCMFCLGCGVTLRLCLVDRSQSGRHCVALP